MKNRIHDKIMTAISNDCVDLLWWIKYIENRDSQLSWNEFLDSSSNGKTAVYIYIEWNDCWVHTLPHNIQTIVHI